MSTAAQLTEDDDADIDEIAVERAVEGDVSVSLTVAELEAAWRALEAEGLSDEEIAERLGTTRRSVLRWTAKGGIGHGRQGQRGAAVQESEIEELIATGKQSAAKRTRAAAERAEGAIEHLRTVLEHESGRQEAEAEVERLSRELAEAKARLRSPRKEVAKPSKTRASAATPVSYREVWQWAAAQGYPIKRGRPPTQLVEQYRRRAA